MNIVKIIQNAVGVAKADPRAMAKVTQNKDAFVGGLLIIALVVFAVAIGAMIFPKQISEVLVYRYGFGDALRAGVVHFIISVLLMWAGSWLAVYFARKKTSQYEVFSVLSHMWIVHLMGIVPALGGVSSLWYLYIAYKYLSKSLGLQWFEVLFSLSVPAYALWWIFSKHLIVPFI